MKPTLKHFVNFSLPYTIILIAILSIATYSVPSFPIVSILDKTTLKWFISFFILIVFLYSVKYFFDDINKKSIRVVTYFLIWTSVCVLRGVFVAKGYWEWKGLVSNTLGLMLPIVAYSATNKIITSSILSVYVKYCLPIFLALIFLIQTDAYGFYLMPISFLILFLPAISNRYKIILFAFVTVVIISDLGARSNVIKFAVPLIILVIYYYKNIISNKLLNSIRLILIIAPFVFFSLGVSGAFNIFNISDYLGELSSKGVDDHGNRNEVDLSRDTRTFLYVEVIESALDNEYWMFGRTPARGNDSVAFGDIEYELTRKSERLGNEVAILNVFTWLGIVGVLLYLLVFFRASYLAINRSKNIYAKMLGVYIAFRWLYSWVEDINNFSLNYFVLWVMIGLCFSYSFRSMTNYEVTIWIRGIFDHRYLNFEKYIKKAKDNE